MEEECKRQFAEFFEYKNQISQMIIIEAESSSEEEKEKISSQRKIVKHSKN